MAKGRIQKKVKAPSAHSRAARRASSPGIDTDKSLKEARPPAPSVNERPAVLAVLNAGGVTKKARKHGRKAVLSSRARRRQEKSAERAEAVVERTAKKMERSKGQAKTLHMRRKAWDEVNDNLTAGTLGKRKRQTTSGQDRAEALGGDGTDEEMDGAEGDQSQPSAGVHAPLMAVDEGRLGSAMPKNAEEQMVSSLPSVKSHEASRACGHMARLCDMGILALLSSPPTTDNTSSGTPLAYVDAVLGFRLFSNVREGSLPSSSGRTNNQLPETGCAQLHSAGNRKARLNR
ncbi:hypothetical protein P8C59_006147 [Phyllachora maydis]|uniref:Ribosome biogenesis protein Alb1 n=1 Tax=Phyllachora maydis TaxID=1825666 RepID=A0AAD9MC80_9PEZI|nr:hypothetical protein P8C59_006147 [Phyllachora maydis]